MIDVTGVNLVELVKKAYELSRPQGLGMIRYDSTPMTDEEAQELINNNTKGEVHLDYVKGRSLKFHVFNKNGKLSMNDSWYDHTDSQLKELLTHVGVDADFRKEHSCSCNCDECRVKRGE